MARTRCFNRSIYFVDDEPLACKTVGRTLKRLCSRVNCFTDPYDCLEQLRLQVCDLLITDVRMDEAGMDGIELLKEARRLAPPLPVMVITGYGDVPMAVRAFKGGAMEFVQKPIKTEAFLSVVESILKREPAMDKLLGKKLTKAEIKVLRLILKGKTNKEIARLLNRERRTVETHRGRAYRKLGVKNAVELFKRAIELGIVNLPRKKKARTKLKSRRAGA